MGRGACFRAETHRNGLSAVGWVEAHVFAPKPIATGYGLRAAHANKGGYAKRTQRTMQATGDTHIPEAMSASLRA